VNARAGFARTLVLIAALALAAAAARAAETAAAAPHAPRTVTAASGRCGVCHPSDRVAFETSPHAHEDVHCTSCHGGDDTTTDQAKAHGGTFTGKVAHASVPRMCARCHADEKAMRPYDLPVDQYELYQQSRHGQLLAKGDQQVAVCSDCHNAHDILAVADPSSTVFPTNIPRTCGKCHGDTMLVRQRKMKNAYADYLTSVHAHQLFDLGNMRAPTCVSCHGVHGATPPDVADVTKVCGRCHTTERRYFIAGPHAVKMAENDLPACVSCHGNHAVQASVVSRLGSNCVNCHEKGDKLEAMGGQMLADYKSAQAEIDKAERVIAEADAVPMPTEDYHARVEEARTYLREAMTAAHTVQPETVAGFTLRARSVGAEIQDELHKKFANARMSKLALVVFWFYVIVTVGILRRYRNRKPRVR
jgi:predicted CXXCH cytochrome family protein